MGVLHYGFYYIYTGNRPEVDRRDFPPCSLVCLKVPYSMAWVKTPASVQPGLLNGVIERGVKMGYWDSRSNDR